jgi:GNAT superfamily N-acetyltransferase
MNSSIKSAISDGIGDLFRLRPMNVQIRQAVETDAEAIATLKTKSWQSAYRGQLPDRFLDDLSLELASRIDYWRMHISTQSSARHEIWTAQCDGNLRAFAAFGPARRDDEAGLGEVYALYVDPPHCGQGVGAALLNHAVQRLSRHHANAVLWVLESNLRARLFYERAGWTLDGGTKLENLPDGTELREVRYRVFCTPKGES